MLNSPSQTTSIDSKPTQVNPKDLIGRTKPPLGLVPPALLIFVSMVMRLGAQKYGPFNWRTYKVGRMTYIEAALRHLEAARDGEDADHESGMPHEANAAACLAILLDAMATGNLIDDRPPKGCAGELIRNFTQLIKSNALPTVVEKAKMPEPPPLDPPALRNTTGFCPP